MKPALRLLVALLSCALLIGCSDDDDPVAQVDAGSDVATQPDSGPDAGDDVGVEPDVQDDAGPDTGPRPEGFFIEGLTGSVGVSFDEHSVLHVECDNDNDCAAVQGYFHAAHRFAQMDLARRALRGRLSAAVGDLGLDSDRARRRVLTTRDGEPLEEVMWAEANAEVRGVIEAYTRGVNAWLQDLNDDRNGARLSEEYSFPLLRSLQIDPWEAEDSVAQMLGLLELLSNNASFEIYLGTVYSRLDAEKAFDLAGLMSATGTSTMGSSGESYNPNLLSLLPASLDLEALDRARQRLAPVQGLLEEAHEALAAMEIVHNGALGSNNWAVGPSRTASGHAMLVNDPHLGLSNPALWYLVRLDSKTRGGDLHATGVSFPGFPGIILGHNDHIGWTGTVANYDLTDIYIETLNADRTAVIFEDGEVPILEREFVFKVNNAPDVIETFKFVPHHGPILSMNEQAGTAVSVRWAGADSRADINMLYAMMKAESIDDARDILTLSTSTNQNWMVMDRDDNIAWFPYSRVPTRPWASMELPPWLPLPGDGSAEWGPPVPYDQLPQMVNPEAGFMTTANQDATGAMRDGDPTNVGTYLQGASTSPGWRHKRIVDVLSQSEDHDADTMLALLGDTHSELGVVIVPAVLAATTAVLLDETGTRLLSALENWDYTCPTGLTGSAIDSDKHPDADIAAASIGCTAFHRLLFDLSRLTFADELQGSGLSSVGSMAFRSLHILIERPEDLVGGESYWNNTTTDFDETRDDIMLAAVVHSAEKLEELLGDDSDDWRWGRVHHLVMGAPLFEGFVSTYNHGPLAAPGGYSTVNVASPSGVLSDDYTFAWGASMRMILENTADGFKSSFQLPGGQRHFRNTEQYNDLLEAYLNNEPFTIPQSAEDAAARAVESFEVLPTP